MLQYFELVFSPEKLSSFGSIIYCNLNELQDDNIITFYSEKLSDDSFIIPILQKTSEHDFCRSKLDNTYDKLLRNLIYISCSDYQGKNIYPKSKYLFTIYHSRSNIDELQYLIKELSLIFQKLEASCNYLAIVDSDNIKIIQKFAPDGIITPKCKNFDYYNPFTNDFSWKISDADESYKYDLVILNKKGGIILLNPKNCIDMIFTMMTKKYSDIDKMFTILENPDYQNLMGPIFYELIDNIGNLQYQNKPSKYITIFRLISENDHEYYGQKLPVFQNQCMKIFNHADEYIMSNNIRCTHLADFIKNIRKEICLELFHVYHRWRNFPSERLMIRKLFPDHPYIILINHIHNDLIIKNKNRFISPSLIENYLFENKKYFTVYDENIILLLKALKYRNQLLEHAYKAYLNTKSCNELPKYKNYYLNMKHSYYPFKVFSPYIFLMDHLLNI